MSILRQSEQPYWKKPMNIDLGQFARRSRSYSGLSKPLLREYKTQILEPLFSLSPKGKLLLGDILEGRMNDVVRQNLLDAYNKGYRNFEKEIATQYQNSLRGAINTLANKGVLDSSVTARALGALAGDYLTQLARARAQLEQKALEEAYAYPFRAAKTYYTLLGHLLSTAKVSGSKSYDPTPAIGLFRILTGL